MPTRDEWKKAHAELMAILKLPCKLRFFSEGVGQHDWEDDLSECYIAVNPYADFRVPEHLILHEGAHHRVVAPYMEGRFSRYEALDAAIDSGNCIHPGHCRHWAEALLGMYKEAGIALPQTTGFKEFAAVAGIVHKVFDKDERKQMQAVARNPGLVEGA